MRIRYLSIVLLLSANALFAAEFFVSPKGHDTNPGTRSRPFASFHRAQQAVRQERTTHPMAGATVTFLAGQYTLDEPLRFTFEDSGASVQAPVLYRAEPGKKVVISGGQAIAGWQRDDKRPGIWKTRVKNDKTEEGASWRFQQLWVNETRAQRARTPNGLELFPVLGVEEQSAKEVQNGILHTFSMRAGDLASLKNLDSQALQDVQLMAFHNWDTTREPLLSLGPGEDRFVSRGDKMPTWNPMNRESLLCFENYLDALDSPGEWFLDREGWLFYYPRPGEDMMRAQVVAPSLERFISVQGKTDATTNQWVEHLRFEGLNFCFAGYRIPREGLRPAQSAMNVDATAIQLDGARDVQFLDCAVEHIGMNAFWFRRACTDCRVERTRIRDLGMTGVRIGETELVPVPVRTGKITIDNCIIQSGGRTTPQSVGVWIGHSADNAITHCDIGDFFYTAVSVGWRWGYDASGAQRNRIEYNHLHHLGYRILSDMGGVYTLGPSPGTSVSHNVIHDVYAFRYGGWGLYPDEGSTGITFENNLVYNVRDGCLHQHYGRENLFRNNILAYSGEGQIALTRAEPHLSFNFERNIVFWDEGHLLGYAGWGKGAKVIFRNNLYWNSAGKPIDFAGKTWDEWRKAGNDEGSLIADPGFVDPAHRNFRLRAKSPAEFIGFHPFDFSQAGVYGAKSWKKLAEMTVFPAR